MDHETDFSGVGRGPDEATAFGAACTAAHEEADRARRWFHRSGPPRLIGDPVYRKVMTDVECTVVVTTARLDPSERAPKPARPWYTRRDSLWLLAKAGLTGKDVEDVASTDGDE